MEIPNWENYTIDFNGNVYSKKSKRFLKQQITTNYTGHKSYKISFRLNGKTKTFLIHRLMGLTYLPNYYGLPEIDHKDRNSLNNNLFNLRWVSRSENSINVRMRPNKKVPFRHINEEEWSWRIRILRNKVFVFSKKFSKNTFTLDEVVKFRNEKYRELDITIDDN